jgi:transcriptional regulator with XRE-family HTH domain
MARPRARALLVALGKKITTLRLHKSWNRTTLAKKAGVTITTLRGLETGTKVTQPDKLRQIAAALGTSLKQLEADDTSDPRVRQWTDEDYVIGNWYHNAPRPLKNRLWALQELPDAGAALLDPDFAIVLERWPALTQPQRIMLLNNLSFLKRHEPEAGGVDAAAPDAKTRGPQR